MGIQLQNKLHQSLDSEMEVKKLQDEKKTVEMLRQQIVSQTPTKGSSLATNGQDEPESSASSQLGSVASLDLDSNLPPEKKNYEKKIIMFAFYFTPKIS